MMLKAQNQVCGVRKRVVGPAAPLAWPLAAHCRTIRSSASNACHAAPRRWWSAAGLRLCAAVRPCGSQRMIAREVIEVPWCCIGSRQACACGIPASTADAKGAGDSGKFEKGAV